MMASKLLLFSFLLLTLYQVRSQGAVRVSTRRVNDLPWTGPSLDVGNIHDGLNAHHQSENRQLSHNNVIGFELINSNTDRKVGDLIGGAVIAQSAFPSKWNVKAVLPSGVTVGSVRFGFKGNTNWRTEDAAPHALCGKSSTTNYRDCDALGVGKYTITATSFSKKGGSGTAGTPFSASFEIVATAPAPVPTAPAPVPTAPAPVPTAPVPTAPVPPVPTASCRLPMSGPNYDIGEFGLEATETFDTSCASGSIQVSLTIGHNGTLENLGTSLDTLKIFYKIDNAPEVLWIDVKGQDYPINPTRTVLAGSALTLRVSGDTTHFTETYTVSNVLITEAAPAPVCGIPQVSTKSDKRR